MTTVSNAQLFAAAMVGDMEVLRAWKSQNPSANGKFTGWNGATPLHFACISCKWEVAEYLVKSSIANANAQDANGDTPLHFACLQGNLACAVYLIQLDSATVEVENGAGATPLLHACRNGHLAVVKHLHSSGADAHIGDNNGNTALFHACQNGHLDIVKHLIQSCNAEVNVENNDGATPLLEACRNGHLDSAKYLIVWGSASVDIRDRVGDTPLHFACHQGDADFAKHVIEAGGAKINVKNRDGDTPLHYACRKGHLDVVKALMESGSADITILNDNNQTPLDKAEAEDRINIIKFFAKHSLYLHSQLQACRQSQPDMDTSAPADAVPSQDNQPSSPPNTNINVGIGQDRLDALHTDTTADITFLCGRDDEQQPIKANCGVLLVTVPSIKSLIDSGIHHQLPTDVESSVSTRVTIPLIEFDAKHVRYVLQCIYSGETSFNNHIGDDGSPGMTTQDDLQQVILVADKFGFWRLKLVVEAELIRKHLAEDTMVDLLLFADQSNCMMLRDAAMNMTSATGNALFDHPSFMELCEYADLMREISAIRKDGIPNCGVDDRYSEMSMMELYGMLDGEESAKLASYMDRKALLEFVRSIKTRGTIDDEADAKNDN